MAFYDLHPKYSGMVNQVISDDIPTIVRAANKVYLIIKNVSSSTNHLKTTWVRHYVISGI